MGGRMATSFGGRVAFPLCYRTFVARRSTGSRLGRATSEEQHEQCTWMGGVGPLVFRDTGVRLSRGQIEPRYHGVRVGQNWLGRCNEQFQ